MEPVAIMASKSCRCRNLAALGAQRLAAILMDLAEHDAETKRRLRLELAGQAGGEIIAAEIGERLTSLKSARWFVDWHKRRDFVKDLDLQRTMIVDRLAPTRPDLALDLMWRVPGPRRAGAQPRGRQQWHRRGCLPRRMQRPRSNRLGRHA